MNRLIHILFKAVKEATRFRQYKLVLPILILCSGCAESLTKPTVVRSDTQQNNSNYEGKRAKLAVATVGWQTNDMTQAVSYDIGAGGEAGGYLPAHTHSQYSTGLTEQLINSLLATKRYRILENQALSTILEEMQLHQVNNTSGNIPIDGADLLVVATITGWSPGESGTQAKVGGLVQKRVSKLFNTVSGGFKKSKMSMNVRVVDIRSREILGGTEIQTEAKDVNLGTTLGNINDITGLNGELETYANTSMEKAIRVAVTEAANFIIENTPNQYYSF